MQRTPSAFKFLIKNTVLIKMHVYFVAACKRDILYYRCKLKSTGSKYEVR